MVLRRLMVIALLALVSLAGVAQMTAMANGRAEASPSAVAVPFTAGGHDDASRAHPCVQQASCAGGALLVGASLVLLLPAGQLALADTAPTSRVPTAPSRLHPALLARKLFRPPRPS